jgi:hypothetical protein
MNMPVDTLEVEAELPEHRIIIFHAAPGKLQEVTLSELRLNWSKLAHDPSSRSRLVELIDSSFPAMISARTCNTVIRRDKGESVEDDSDKKGSLKTEDAREAYKAACKWWIDSMKKVSSAFQDHISEGTANRFKLMVQWQAGTNPTQANLQLSLAKIMNRSSDTLRIVTTFADERIAIFEPADDTPKSKLELFQAWKKALMIFHAAEEHGLKSADNLEHSFPGAMYLQECRNMLANPEGEPLASEEEDVKLKKEQQRMMRVACKWWTDQLPTEETQPAKTEEQTTA